MASMRVPAGREQDVLTLLCESEYRPASESNITYGAFVGTPAFASPEQVRGAGVDIRSDLYSLGVIVWQMVAGKAPFRGSPTEVMYQHQHASLPIDNSKMSRSRSPFYLRCSFRRIRVGVLKVLPNS